MDQFEQAAMIMLFYSMSISRVGEDYNCYLGAEVGEWIEVQPEVMQSCIYLQYVLYFIGFCNYDYYSNSPPPNDSHRSTIAAPSSSSTSTWS